MLLTGGLLFVVLILVVAFAAIPKKKPEHSFHAPTFHAPAVNPFTEKPQPVRVQSMREQQLTEDALLMADEYRVMQEDMQRAAIREGLEVAAAYQAMKKEKRQAELKALFVS